MVGDGDPLSTDEKPKSMKRDRPLSRVLPAEVRDAAQTGLHGET